MEEQLKSLLESDFTITGWQVFAVFLVSVVGYAANSLLQRVSSFLFQQQIIWISRLRYWVPLARIVVWTVTVFTVVRIISPPAELLFGLLTSAGVAIGLAAQDLVKNIFGAIVIWTDRVYSEGDRVQINDVHGIVKSIGLRSTKVWAYDDTEISVPNSELLTASVYNANSGTPPEQVVIDLYLPLDADTDRALELARMATLSAEYLDTNYPIVVQVFDELQDRAMSKIRVKAYVRGVLYEKSFISEITAQTKSMFREHGLYGPAISPTIKESNIKEQHDG